MPPANDNFANATPITSLSGSTSADNVGATTETGESPGYNGFTVWYAVTMSARTRITITVSNTGGAQWWLEVGTGTAISNLKVFSSGTTLSWVAEAGTTYYIQFDTDVQSATSMLNWSGVAMPVGAAGYPVLLAGLERSQTPNAAATWYTRAVTVDSESGELLHSLKQALALDQDTLHPDIPSGYNGGEWHQQATSDGTYFYAATWQGYTVWDSNGFSGVDKFDKDLNFLGRLHGGIDSEPNAARNHTQPWTNFSYLVKDTKVNAVAARAGKIYCEGQDWGHYIAEIDPATGNVLQYWAETGMELNFDASLRSNIHTTSSSIVGTNPTYRMVMLSDDVALVTEQSTGTVYWWNLTNGQAFYLTNQTTIQSGWWEFSFDPTTSLLYLADSGYGGIKVVQVSNIETTPAVALVTTIPVQDFAGGTWQLGPVYVEPNGQYLWTTSKGPDNFWGAWSVAVWRINKASPYAGYEDIFTTVKFLPVDANSYDVSGTPLQWNAGAQGIASLGGVKKVGQPYFGHKFGPQTPFNPSREAFTQRYGPGVPMDQPGGPAFDLRHGA